MNTPKYVGVKILDRLYPEIVCDGDNYKVVDAKLTDEPSSLDELKDLYIRERDLRRQFSPAEASALADEILLRFGVNLDPQRAGTSDTHRDVIAAIINRFRELVHTP